jgi:tRNA-specific 2-thiouridylase
MCNKEIKFGLFFEKAMEMGADFVATGHYVKAKRSALFAARDKNKDQGYFLWALTQKQLAKCLFPIGDYLKPEVRNIAKKAGLSTAEKKDSQGICFLGQVSIDDFLKDYIPEKKGDILLAQSGVEGFEYKKIGKHKGAHFYTIGQRHIGASIKYPVESSKQGVKKNRQPYYVAEKDVKKNILILAEGENNPALYKKEIELIDVNFIDAEYLIHNIKYEMSVMARIRYGQPLQKAKLIISINRKNQHKSVCRLIFNEPVKFVAPGQSAVFYCARRSSGKGGYELLGGGVIK